jgi:signal transduction histidine kinase
VDIAQEALGMIFEVFRQHDASTTRSYNGVGLGLYVAKKCGFVGAQQSQVQSEIGRGSVFTVRLPYNLDLELAKRNPALDNLRVPESPYSLGNKEL